MHFPAMGMGECLFPATVANALNLPAGLQQGAARFRVPRRKLCIGTLSPALAALQQGDGLGGGWVPAPLLSPAGVNDPRRSLAACLLSQRSFLPSLFSALGYY